MPRSKDIRTYPMRFYEAVESAARLGELRISLPDEKKAKTEQIAFCSFRNAARLHMENTPREDQSAAVSRVWVFMQDIEFSREGCDFIIRKSSASDSEIAINKAIAAARHRAGFQQTFEPYIPDPIKPPDADLPTSPEQLPAEPNPDLASALEKLHKWVDPAEDILKSLGYLPDDKPKDSE